jgi:hypothetical protein
VPVSLFSEKLLQSFVPIINRFVTFVLQSFDHGLPVYYLTRLALMRLVGTVHISF